MYAAATASSLDARNALFFRSETGLEFTRHRATRSTLGEGADRITTAEIARRQLAQSWLRKPDVRVSVQ